MSVRREHRINPVARRLRGLHVTGELLDTWAETGGYNLHFAWATGIATGEAVAGRPPEMEGL